MKKAKEIKVVRSVRIPVDLEKLVGVDPTFNLSNFVTDKLKEHFNQAKTLEEDKEWFKNLPQETQDDLIWSNVKIKAKEISKANAFEKFERNHKDKISKKDMNIIRMRVFHINPYKDIDVELGEYAQNM